MSTVRLFQELDETTTEKQRPVGNRSTIRDWVVAELVRTYHYPQGWVGTRIISVPSKEATGIPKGFYGVCVLGPLGKPMVLVSVAQPGSAETAEKLLNEALRDSATAGLGFSTDGSPKGTKFLRRRFDSPKCEYVVDLETYAEPERAAGPKAAVREGARRGRGGPDSRQLEPLSERVESVFFEAHSHIRDIDGLHADEALDELCKLLLVKLYDEQSTPPGEAYRLQRWLYGSVEELASATRALLEEASGVQNSSDGSGGDGGRFRAVSRPLRLSSPALSKVIECLQNYSLTNSPIDVKGRAFQQLVTPAVRSGMGQFFTPHEVIAFIVAVVEPRSTDVIIDPFAGSGKFLTTCLERLASGGVTGATLKRFAARNLHGIEKSDRMVRIALTDMRLHGDGLAGLRCADSLLDFSNYTDVRPESFDVVVTNPPFGSIVSGEALGRLGRFELAQGRNGIPLELLGLERCLQLLRPGGRLGIVLPEGVLGNHTARYVREWLEGQGKVRAIVSLPIETFMPFGASVRTCILFLRKWRSGEVRSSEHRVGLVRIDGVGYDASGRVTKSSDLVEARERLGAFIASEGW